MTTINDLLDTIEHIARGLAEDDDLYAAEDELAEVRRRVAELEAEAAVNKTRHAKEAVRLIAANNRVFDLEIELHDLRNENARLKVRAEAREAQLRHAQTRLHRLGQAEADVEGTLDGLTASGAAVAGRWWDGLGEAEARVTVAEGRAAEVDAAMLAIGFYPVGVPVPLPDGMAHGYSTDGTPPWEAPDEAVVPRGGVGC